MRCYFKNKWVKWISCIIYSQDLPIFPIVLKTSFQKQGFMVKPHTSDIRVTYRVYTSDIPMTYEHYQWHTDDIRVYTSDIRMTYEYIRLTHKWHDIRMTFEWHTNDMRFERKIKLSFLKLFDNSLPKYLICKKIPCMQWLFWVI